MGADRLRRLPSNSSGDVAPQSLRTIQMTRWLWLIIRIYVVGFVLVFVGHILFLQMITPALAFWRAVFWPVFWLIGVATLLMD